MKKTRNTFIEWWLLLIGAFSFYPHMPIGKVWIYRLLFVCFFVIFVILCECVCTVEDLSAEDKASGVKFCMVVHRRPGQGISHFGKLCAPRNPKSAGESATARTELYIELEGAYSLACRPRLTDIAATFYLYSSVSARAMCTTCRCRSACVDIRPSPKTDVLLVFFLAYIRLRSAVVA